jgi:sec-independent protein translocase protein TatB
LFGIGWPEFLVIMAVAVVVIGPEDLPRALHAVGKLARKFKRITGDLQKSIDDVLHEEELNEIIRDANKPGGENLQLEIERQLALEESADAEDKKSGTNG